LETYTENYGTKDARRNGQVPKSQTEPFGHFVFGLTISSVKTQNSADCP